MDSSLTKTIVCKWARASAGANAREWCVCVFFRRSMCWVFRCLVASYLSVTVQNTAAPFFCSWPKRKTYAYTQPNTKHPSNVVSTRIEVRVAPPVVLPVTKQAKQSKSNPYNPSKHQTPRSISIGHPVVFLMIEFLNHVTLELQQQPSYRRTCLQNDSLRNNTWLHLVLNPATTGSTGHPSTSLYCSTLTSTTCSE